MNAAFDYRGFRFFARKRFWAAIWDELYNDDCLGMSAELSFFFLLAFFPFLMFLSALIGFIPFDPGLLNKILVELYNFLPTRTYELVRDIIQQLVQSGDKGILSVGIILALWSASMGFNAMVRILNNAYELKETRSYFHTRGLSILVTLLVSFFVIASGFLLFFGDWMIQLLFEREFVKVLYSIMRWIVVVLLLNVGIQIVYYALPVRRPPWKIISPGSLCATFGWIFGSVGFNSYINQFGNYQRLYGSLGTLVILMIWFYLCSLLLILGGEIDAEIYRLRKEERRPMDA